MSDGAKGESVRASMSSREVCKDILRAQGRAWENLGISEDLGDGRVSCQED